MDKNPKITPVNLMHNVYKNPYTMTKKGNQIRENFYRREQEKKNAYYNKIADLPIEKLFFQYTSIYTTLMKYYGRHFSKHGPLKSQIPQKNEDNIRTLKMNLKVLADTLEEKNKLVAENKRLSIRNMNTVPADDMNMHAWITSGGKRNIRKTRKRSTHKRRRTYRK